MDKKGRITEKQLYSAELQEDITLLIYLPNTFSPLYKYQLLITADGRDYFQLGRVGRLADRLLADKEIDNVIIVGVCYKDVKDRWSKYHPNGGKHDAYIRFLAHELVTFLDREFPTYQMGSTRALIGDSLGATVSLLTSLRYPHTFGKVVLQSPYVNEEVLQYVQNYGNQGALSIYHVIGKKETAVKTTNEKTVDFLTPNRTLSEYIRSQNSITYFYDEFDGDHTWTFWQPDLDRALRMTL